MIKAPSFYQVIIADIIKEETCITINTIRNRYIELA